MKFTHYFFGKPNTTFTQAVQNLPLSGKSTIVTMQQVHGNDSTEITLKSIEDQNSQKIIKIQTVDACYTSLPNIFLSVKTADCLPVLLSGFGIQSGQPTPFIAAAHAGRKGTQKEILKKLLEKLEETYNFVSFLQQDQQNLQKNKLSIWFGPAICENCYQIDRETDTHFDLTCENEKQISDFFKLHGLDPEQHLDLEIVNHCTLHEPEKFHSYRKTGPGVPMNYSLICIE